MARYTFKAIQALAEDNNLVLEKAQKGYSIGENTFNILAEAKAWIDSDKAMKTEPQAAEAMIADDIPLEQQDDAQYFGYTAYFNSSKQEYSFSHKPGCKKIELLIKKGYQVERAVQGESFCGNLIYGDYYLYQGDDDSCSWTCQEAIKEELILSLSAY